MIRLGSIFFIIGLLLFLCSFGRSAAQQRALDSLAHPAATGSFSLPSYDFLRDTLFVLDSVYLEVRLDQQAIYQHFRNGRTKRFSCSTGNPRQPDAIATREGIFSIQWKSQRYMSKQFEVWLNYWMPFDGGIGFHGLDSRSYYKYLGRRPSSHGCVRISNETGRDMFATTPRGTAVYVHSGSPARILQFADSGQSDLRVVTATDESLLGQRLDAVVHGYAEHPSLKERLALPKGEKLLGTISVGKANRSMHVQYRTEPIRLSLADDVHPRTEPEPIQLLPPLSFPLNATGASIP